MHMHNSTSKVLPIYSFTKGSAHEFKPLDVSPVLSLEELTERLISLESKVRALTSQLKSEEALTLAKSRPYITIKEAMALYLPVSEKSIRWFYFNNTEGFKSVVTKRGRRLWLNTEKLKKWIDDGGMRHVLSRG